jgi:hypothetical protein
MKVEDGPAADARAIRWAAGPVADSDEVRPGVVPGFDAEGRVLGLELLDLVRRTANPREMAFARTRGLAP